MAKREASSLPDVVVSPEKKLRLFKTQKLNFGATTLMEAALFGSLEDCVKLVAKGADTRATTKEHKVSVLHFAAVNKKHGLEIVDYFVSLGCELLQPDCDREYPIDYALREESYEVAKKIVKRFNEKANLFHYCIYKNNLEYAKVVHKLYSDLVHEPEFQGATSLLLAAAFADESMCKWLTEELGFDANCTSAKLNNTALHNLKVNVQHGKDLVPFFVSKGLDVNQVNKNGWTPLYSALIYGNIEVAAALTACNANLKSKYEKNSMLSIYIEKNNLSCVKSIFGQHSEPNVDDSFPKMIKAALMHADEKMCRWLYEESVDKKIPLPAGNSFLHFAAFNMKFGRKVVRFCIDTLASEVNARNKEKEPPICIALLNENIKAADELYKHGASLRVTVDGRSILGLCLETNRWESVKFICLKDKTLMNQVDSGMTLACHTARFVDLQLFGWLAEEAKVDFSARCAASGATVLHSCAVNTRHGTNIAEYAISTLGIDVNAKCNAGETPLLAALKNQNFALAEFLCDRGADLKIRLFGCTLSCLFVKWNMLPCAQFVHEKDRTLLEDVSDDGRTAFLHAAASADFEMCHWLLTLPDGKVDPYEFCECSESNALHFAASNTENGQDLIDFFLQDLFMMNLNDGNIAGETPITVALRAGNADAVKAFCEYGAKIDVDSNETNLLVECVYLNDLASAELLHKLDKTLIDDFSCGGKNALHIAALLGNRHFCKYLVESGANIHALTDDGESVLDLVPWYDRELREYFRSCLALSNM